MFDTVSDLFGQLQGAVFESLVQPAMTALGLTAHLETAYSSTEWFLYGLIEIVLIYALLRPLEAARPVEAWPDRRAVRVDVIYTLLNRLGVVPLIVFSVLFVPLADFDGWLRMHDIIPPQLEDFLPGLALHPAVSFGVYLVIIDCAEYWRHRLQHRVPVWWALHALHHSQRQLTFWSDNRNHLLDEIIAGVWLALVGLLVGMPPGQFVLAVILLRGVESLSHANVRLPFGAWGERLLVSPRFHRVHHAIEFAQGRATHGVNFAVLFPVWDVLFGSADFTSPIGPTGVEDPLQGRDYGQGFWHQQVLGLKRVFAVIAGRSL